jgi:hypothetical protein
VSSLRTSDAARRRMRRHLIARDGLACARCGDPIEREVPSIGHRIALANGGTDYESNLGLEHLDCNRRAGTAGFFSDPDIARQSTAAPNGAQNRPIRRTRARVRLIRPDFEV